MKPPSGHRKRRRFINDPAHVHEFTFSCYHRLPLLAKDRTRAWFLDSLRALRQRKSVSVLAYVIMPEHAHVLLVPSPDPLAMEMVSKFLKQSVARRALHWLRVHDPVWLKKHLQGENAGGRFRYHFWQPGGGYDRNLDRFKTIEAAVDYIHNNPVRRKLAPSPVDSRIVGA